jgi:hypothetical protein
MPEPLVVTQPQPLPGGPGERRARRRRIAPIAVAAGAVAVVAIGGLLWTVQDAGNRFRDWVAGAPATPDPDRTGRSADPSTASPSASGPVVDAEGRTPQASEPSPTASGTPRPIGLVLQRLDAKSSLSFEKPFQRDDPDGDIRFDCEDVGCALKSDTSVFVQIFTDEGVSLDECGPMLAHADRHRWPLASVPVGGQICVKHASGDIALLTVQTKQTALQELAALTVDMTIWRAAS